MASALNSVVRQVHKSVLLRDANTLSDRQLLERFTACNEEFAFETLVLRHGPMVLNVCRRILGNVQDAEDAFQATFLVFARKKTALGVPELLGNWLYGVAYRTALKAKSRRAREKQVRDMPHPMVEPGVDSAETLALLDQELNRLPEKYRVPVVLCELQGKSRKEVARELKLPEGTLSSRLATARKMLAKRLAGRGLTLSAAALTAALSQNAASASIPTALVSSTVSVAVNSGVVSSRVAGLAEEVLKAMFLAKLKIRSLVGLLVLFTASAFLYGLGAAQPAGPKKDKTPENQAGARSEKETPPQETIISGIVVDSEGKTVSGAKVELKGGQVKLGVVSQSDGKFQMTVPQVFKYGFGILARSAYGERLAYRRFGEKEDSKALRIMLEPGRPIHVSVADDKGQPVASGHVGALSGELHVVADALTDGKGRATLRVPKDGAIEQVYAWQHRLGFDYRPLNQSNDKASGGDLETIAFKLEGARTLRVTVRDSEGQPIPKLPMYPWLLRKPGASSEINLSGANEIFAALTDEQGIATWDWLPVWQKEKLTVWPISKEYAQSRYLWDPKGPAGEATLVLHRLEALRGQVRHHDGKPAVGIVVRADGDCYDFDAFRGETTTDAAGNYELRVAPIQLYLVVVVDAKWATDPHTGFAVLPKTPIDNKDFVLRPATIIHGKVTLGKDEKPHANQHLFLSQHGTDNLVLPNALPNPGKSRRYVRPSVGHSTSTDAEGRFEFRVGPGSFSLRGPSQIEPVEFTVTNQDQMEINLNAPREELGRLKGKVVTGTPPTPVADAVLQGIYQEGRAGRDLAGKTDAAGNFDLERQKHPLIFFARSADRKLAGVVEVGSEDAVANVTLAKVASAQGRLIEGEMSEPLASREIRYGVRVYMGKPGHSPFRTAFGGNAKTDSAGRFELTNLVPGQKYYVAISNDNESWRTLHTLIPREDESIKIADLKVMPERVPPTPKELRQAAFDVKGLPIERFEKARSDVRLSNQQVLVIFASPHESTTEKLYAMIGDRESFRDLLDDYRIMWIATDAKRLPEARALADNWNIKLGADDAPTLALVNEKGILLAELNTAPSWKDGDLEAKIIRDFLQGPSAIVRLDGAKLLADTLAQAKKENKRVLIQETATWCGPCWRLSRFLDQHRRLWEKDYLWIKMDHRWKDARKVMEPLRAGAEGGIPWVAILDAEGKVLATSNDKEGQNIGFPSEASAITHFAAMLSTTAIRLMPAEIAELTEALKGVQ